MSGQILDGKALALKLKEQLAQTIKQLKKAPRVVSIVIGSDPAGLSYVASQQKAAQSLGIGYELKSFPEDVSQQDVLTFIQGLNTNADVHGIMVNKPLPQQMDFKAVINAVLPSKDIEGMNLTNFGLLFLGEEGIVPCTAAASLELLKSSGVVLKGKRAVVIGRSEIVGKPVALLLLREDMTVTVCHSKTVDLPMVVREADVVVVALGKPNFVKGDWIKPGAVVIDVGINQVEGKLVGDVEFNSVQAKASYITPVPGGGRAGDFRYAYGQCGQSFQITNGAMKTLVVGNSLDVLAVIENILRSDQGAEVTLFATEGVLPYDRSLLPALLNSSDEKMIFKTAEIFLSGMHPQVVSNETLNRISVKRRYLTTDKKTQINYDRLALVDTGHLLLPDIKGHQREGVFDCWRLSSIKALKKHLTYAEAVTVVVTKPQGLNVVCALSHLKKEVTVITSGPGLLPEIFDEETGLLLKQILEGKGIRVLSDNGIEEILGDAEVKAVKLKSGKVLAADTVIFDEARADIRMLSEPTLTDDDKICIEESFKPMIMPFAPATFGLDLLQGFYAGWTKLPEGGREYLKFDGPQNIYKKIYAHGDHLAGAVLFNAPQDQERLLGILQRRDNIAGREEQLI